MDLNDNIVKGEQRARGLGTLSLILSSELGPYEKIQVALLLVIIPKLFRPEWLLKSVDGSHDEPS